MKLNEILTEDEKPTIVFANHNQVILYTCEIEGQLSDGHWENSKPNDHWQIMTRANVTSGGTPGLNFYPKRKYNFADKELLEAVGDRMVWYVKFYNTFKNFSLDKHWDIDVLNPTDGSPILTSNDSYYAKKREELMKMFNVETVDGLKSVVDKVNKYNYNRAQLVKDLKQMSQIVNSKR